MNSELNNKETQVSNKNEYNDKDILQDVLTSLKSLDSLYSIAKQEASNEELYDSFDEFEMDVSECQREAFETMYALGWYTLTKSPQTKIDETLKKFNQMKQELQQN